MRIVLIIPPSPGRRNIIRMIDCSHEAKADYLWQPNDLMIITSLLGQMDKVEFIDGTADRLDEEQFTRALRQVQGDLLIFALSSVCWESDYAYFLLARRLLPYLPVFVLGDIFLDTRYQDLILRDADGIITNPYVLDLHAMADIRRERSRALPGICMTPGIDFFPHRTAPLMVTSGVPRHELFLKHSYRFPFAKRYRFTTVTTTWGCPFSCSYCTDSNFPPVVRDYRDVLKELAAVDGLGIRELFIADKVFGFSAPNVQPLLEMMARQYAFSWTCYFHPQLYKPELLELMHRAGCHTIITGIDSADIFSLQRYGRRVDPRNIEQLIGHANRLGISVCADFILGLEHETESDVERTIRMALELPIDFASFNVAAPLPGSDIRRRVVGEDKLVFGKEGFDTCGRMGILGSANVSPERLRKLRTEAFRAFYLRPAYLLRRLRHTRSVEHLMIQVQQMLSMMGKV